MRNHSYENEFHLHVHFHANQSHFHFNGLARRLVLKLRQRATRKWPIIILKKFKTQILKLHAGWMSGQEIERMMNDDELSDTN